MRKRSYFTSYICHCKLILGDTDGYSEGALYGKIEVSIKIAAIGIPLAALGTYGIDKLWSRHKKSKSGKVKI